MGKKRRFIIYHLAFSIFFLLGSGWLVREYVKSEWQGQERFTIVDVGTQVKIISVDPESQEGLEITLPGNLEIETVAGRGKLLVGTMANTREKKWMADSIADYLGVRSYGLKTELGWWDNFRFRKISGQVKWTKLKLEESRLVEKSQTVDGIEIVRLGPGWPEWARDKFRSTAVAREGLAVTIVNTTGVDGLGSQAARIVESEGMKVVMLKTENEKLDRCLVIGEKSMRKKLGVDSLIDNFQCDWKSLEGMGNDVILKLGEEYRKWKSG